MCSRRGDASQHVPSPAERGDARGPQELRSEQATPLLAAYLGARPAESDRVRTALPTPAPRPLPKVSAGPR